MLTVLEEYKDNGRCKVRCLCDCGNETCLRRYMLTITRSTKSCGCIRGTNQPTREMSGSWKGGRRIEDGYVLVYDPKHHKAKSNGYVREHQIVMESKLNRKLLPNENVHHINGDKQDNRPENLELWVRSQPCGQRAKDLLEWAKEIIKIYG